MADPRLNSIHLDPPRRQDYRRARDLLLNARGWQTIAAENQPVSASVSDSNTILQNRDNLTPPNLKYWLADGDFVYPLKLGLNTVGRSPDNDVIVADSYVSRRHCAILVHTTETCELHDTASKNGTFVNGRKMAGPVRLQTGDEIRMCDKQFVFMSRSGAPGPPDPTATQSD